MMSASTAGVFGGLRAPTSVASCLAVAVFLIFMMKALVKNHRKTATTSTLTGRKEDGYWALCGGGLGQTRSGRVDRVRLNARRTEGACKLNERVCAVGVSGISLNATGGVDGGDGSGGMWLLLLWWWRWWRWCRWWWWESESVIETIDSARRGECSLLYRAFRSLESMKG